MSAVHDVIIVGARVAGSPLAMLLARHGLKVLLLEKARFPKDTLSTHLIWPVGVSYLNRWGIWDKLKQVTPSWEVVPATFDGIHIEGRVRLEVVERRLEETHGESRGAVTVSCSPRRFLLDQMLREEAGAAGAEVREGFTVDELIVEDGRVVGIRGRTAEGASVEERARIVVGADGRNSFVARKVQAAKLRERERCTFCYYTYYSGNTPPKQLNLRGRFAMAVTPTNHDRKMVLVMGPDTWFHDFRASIEANFDRLAQFVAPETAEQLRQCQREEPFRGSASMANYYRHPVGPGWALTGDAAYAVDQATAVGISHAFRSAELLSAALRSGLSGEIPMDEALERYARKHTELAELYFDVIGDRSECRIPSRERLEMLVGLRSSQAAIDDFIATTSDAQSPRIFSQRVDELRAVCTPDDAKAYPPLREYESYVQLHSTHPFG